jgi:SAM-dependent methyltransferase/uncharacterized protein YbaR (Trm112 family)
MVVSLCCPVHNVTLREVAPQRLGHAGCSTLYEVVKGVPVLLPDEDERIRTAVATPSGSADALDFYNRTHEDYWRTDLHDTRAEIERWAAAASCEGPSLEIGSGHGALQGIGGDYVAVDYSLSALASHIDPKHQRVCATAERLPFPDASFRLIFTIAALEHVPNADMAFDEIHRVLKPGGVAYVCPAWHCVQYNCDGIPVRPYGDLTLMQKVVKATLPIRQLTITKAITTLPGRIARRAVWGVSRKPTFMRFERLRPEYKVLWTSDSDASARLDSHEGCLFFHSRGYDVLNPGPSVRQQILARHIAVVVRKPVSSRQAA